MKLIIHDLEQENFLTLYNNIPDDVIVIGDNGDIKNCIGCFGCWIKTPGVCVLKDRFNNMGELLSKCDELIIISKCIYGSYSPFIRNILDRSIPFILPYFMTKNGETHHKPRYKTSYNFSVFFYSEDITSEEKKTATNLVKANSINFHVKQSRLHFSKNLQEMKEVLG